MPKHKTEAETKAFAEGREFGRALEVRRLVEELRALARENRRQVQARPHANTAQMLADHAKLAEQLASTWALRAARIAKSAKGPINPDEK